MSAVGWDKYCLVHFNFSDCYITHCVCVCWWVDVCVGVDVCVCGVDVCVGDECVCEGGGGDLTHILTSFWKINGPYLPVKRQA